MTRNKKIQAAAAILREKAESTTNSAAFIVTITDGAEPEIELTPDHDRIRKDNNAASVQILCRAFYHTAYVTDVCRAFGLHCYISFREVGDSYCVRIY